jgi:hypothetical protein
VYECLLEVAIGRLFGFGFGLGQFDSVRLSGHGSSRSWSGIGSFGVESF